MNQSTQNEKVKTEITSILITKSPITNDYIASQTMNYDFYLLYLLFTQSLPEIQATNKFKKNAGIDFCKNSSIKSLATSQLFIHKNNGHIELFSIYDLANTDDLCLPKSPKFIMTAKNFMNFMIQKNQICKLQPNKLFIALDECGHAHLTTDLQTLTKKSFFAMLQKNLASLFWRPAK
jgi:hypothetical protein